MQQAVRFGAIWGICAGACLGLGLLGGCDNVETPGHQADKNVAKALKDARSASNDDKALKILQDIQQFGDASGYNKAAAKAVEGQIKLGQAREMMRQPDLGQKDAPDAVAHQLLLDIGRLTGRIVANTQMRNGYLLHEPAEALKAVEKQKAAFAAKLAEVKAGTDQKPGLDKLTADITAQETEVQTLTQQKATASEQSAAKIRAADAAKGQASLDLYKQGLDLRQQADGSASKIQQISAKLEIERRDQVAAREQETLLNEAIAGCAKQTDAINQAWANTKKEANACQAASAAVLNGGEGAAPTTSSAAGDSIAAKAADLKKTLESLQQRDVKVIALLNESVKLYQEAATEVNRWQMEMEKTITDGKLSTQSQKDAWAEFKKTIGPGFYNLGAARAYEELGNLQARRMRLFAEQLRYLQDLTAALAASGDKSLAAPAGLIASNPEQSRDKARTDALATYKKLLTDDRLLKSVSSGGPGISAQDKAEGQKMSILVQYSVYHVTGQETDLTEARGLRTQYDNDRKLLADLPRDLDPTRPLPKIETPAPPPPASAPATAPAIEAVEPVAPAVP